MITGRRGDRPDATAAVGAVRRAFAIFAGAGLLLSLLLFHLYQVQVLGHEAHRSVADKQSSKYSVSQRARGTVFDAQGEVLALSVPRPSVGLDLKCAREGKNALSVAMQQQLAEALGLDAETMARKFNAPLQFVWLRRLVTPEQEARVRELGFKAVEIRIETDRAYPQGSIAVHALGFVNIDEIGIEGLEQKFDRILAPTGTREPVRVDAFRRTLGGLPPRPEGCNIRLTLDVRIQTIVEQTLDEAVAEWTPQWASVVVLDPRTGAVLAMASRPTFDPNRIVIGADGSERLNRSLAATYEPGSLIKPMIVAAALEAGVLSPSERFTCEGRWSHAGCKPVRCHKEEGHGTLDVAGVLTYSCNVGAAKIGVRLGNASLHRTLTKLGFGTRRSRELFAENPGRVLPLSKWSKTSATRVPIGHEFAATPLQLAAAVMVIANDGFARPVRLIERIDRDDDRVLYDAGPVEGVRVFSREACEQVRAMMAQSVENGTGREARLEGVVVAGKTGTSQKVDPATGTYTSEKHLSSFACFAPAGPDQEARVVVMVVLDEPQGSYYGGKVAAPVAGRILSKVWPLLK